MSQGPGGWDPRTDPRPRPRQAPGSDGPRHPHGCPLSPRQSRRGPTPRPLASQGASPDLRGDSYREQAHSSGRRSHKRPQMQMWKRDA